MITQDDLVLTILVLGMGGLISCLYYIQVLRSRIRLYLPSYAELDFDPGPLDDASLRKILCSKVMRASKTLDRVQDAYDRLLREKKELQAIAKTANTSVQPKYPARRYYMDE